MSRSKADKANSYGYEELQKRTREKGYGEIATGYPAGAQGIGEQKEIESRPLNEVIPWLLPLMREYAAKLNTLSERVAVVRNAAFETQTGSFDAHWLVESARLISLHDALLADVEQIASYGSGLVEHAPLDYETKQELTLRTNEIEEHLRFSKLVIGQLVEDISHSRKAIDTVRKLIEKSGRYKSPV